MRDESTLDLAQFHSEVFGDLAGIGQIVGHPGIPNRIPCRW